MDWKRLLKSVLYPHFMLLIIFIPISAVLLVYSFVIANTDSIIAYISYFISAYTLTIICIRIPQISRYLKHFKDNNKLMLRWSKDTDFRIKISLFISFSFNTVYAILHFVTGYRHNTLWFYSLASYYLSLSCVRFSLLIHTIKHKSTSLTSILKMLRAYGVFLLVMNFFISVIVFFMVYWSRTFYHSEITTIAIATYTFSTLTMSIIGLIRYQRTNNPIYMASKTISLVASCVSLLTLETTMLTTFGNETMSPETRRIMLAISGAIISLFIISVALNMIVYSNKQIKRKQEAQPR